MSKYPGAQDRRSLERRIQALEKKVSQLTAGVGRQVQAARDLSVRYAEGRLDRFVPHPGTVGPDELSVDVHAVRIVNSLPILPDDDYVVGVSHVYLTQDDGDNLGERLYKCIAETGVPDDDWQYIVAAELIGGLVDGAQIKEDTIAAKNIVITDWDNRVTDPLFETAAEWATVGGVSFVSLEAGSPASTGAELDGDGVSAASLRQASVAVTAGDTLRGSLYVEEVGTAPTLNFSVEFFADGGVSLGTFDFASVAAGGATTWTSVGSDVVVPANATTAQVVISHASVVAAGNGHLVTRAVVALAGAGSLLVDGSISAKHLAVDAVTAGTIAAAAVNTRELSAGTIEITNAERSNAALSFKDSGGSEVLRLGNIAAKGVGADYGLWGVLESGVFIEGAPRLILAGRFQGDITLGGGASGTTDAYWNKVPLLDTNGNLVTNSIVIPPGRAAIILIGSDGFGRRFATGDPRNSAYEWGYKLYTNGLQRTAGILSSGTHSNFELEHYVAVYHHGAATNNTLGLSVTCAILEIDDT